MTEIADFYQSPVGKMAHSFLCARLQKLLPRNVNSKTLLIGFGAPFKEDISIVTGGEVISVDPGQMPLPYGDVSFDNVIAIHELEFASDIPRAMSEMQRVLISDGRLICLTSNRRGIWQWFEQTPWGEGRSFSASQMRHLLLASQLSPIGISTALFMPPFDFSRHGALRSFARAIEASGNYLLPYFGGVLIAAAQKQRYAPIGIELAARPAPINLQWAAAHGTRLGTT